MFGFIYLFLCFAVGYVFCTIAFPGLSSFTEKTYSGKQLRLCPFFLLLPAWWLSGTMLMTWATYALGYLFRSTPEPLLWSNVIVIPLFATLSAAGIVFLFRKKRDRGNGLQLGEFTLMDLVFVILTGALSLFLMWWTFFVKNNHVYVGFSVFSDFAPHMGMIRSFSFGNNFPTQYSHFAGEDMKYHFMFQFLVGNLEYLGMRIDYAFNLPSACSMLGVFSLLYVLAAKLTGYRYVGYVSAFLFAFRSSDAFFDFLKTVPKEVGILKALRENMEFIGTTTNESWGLWNLNVYCNQRHLALGLCVLLFLVIVLMQNVFDAATRARAVMAAEEERLAEKYAGLTLLWPERAGLVAKNSLFCSKGWLPSSLRSSLALAVILGMCCFFNGACVIACLAVLFVMAIVADRRLEYAIVAAITVGMTLLATGFFMEGSAVDMQYFYGFLADNKTLFGAIDYIMTLCGIMPLVLLAAFLIANGTKKWIMFAFSAPFILAFTLSLTVDITVNHKYIMISLMLLSIPAATFLHWLWKRYGIWPKMISIGLLFVLTVTGIYDLDTVIKKNDNRSGRCLVFSQEDVITNWVAENATSQDIFLTSYYSLNNFVMGGAMLYYGWPYYAWSAGYDTPSRDEQVRLMYEADTPEELDAMIREHNIRFVVVDNDVRMSQEYSVNEENIKNTYECVFTYEMTSIYDTTKKK